MTALIVGLLLLLFTVYSVLPQGLLHWWGYVLQFVKGGIPVITLLVGLVAVLIGIADIRDRMEERREEREGDSEEDKDSVSADSEEK